MTQVQAGNVVLIVGTSSVGKSSIIAELQDLLTQHYLALGIDTFFQMVAPRWGGGMGGPLSVDGFRYVRDSVDGTPYTRITYGPIGEHILRGMHRVYLFFPEAGLDEELHMPTCAEAGGSIAVQLKRPAPMLPERRVLTSGCGGGITFDDVLGDRPPLHSDLRVEATQIVALMRELNYQARLYRQSRGVHTSALSDGERLLVLAEDVGRHNTLDKIRGEVLLQGLPTKDRILLTSGRISSEMITKARKMEVPIVVSRTSPTATSVRLAESWNMTLIGYVRAPQLRVYTGAERVLFGRAEEGED